MLRSTCTGDEIFLHIKRTQRVWRFSEGVLMMGDIFTFCFNSSALYMSWKSCIRKGWNCQRPSKKCKHVLETSSDEFYERAQDQLTPLIKQPPGGNLKDRRRPTKGWSWPKWTVVAGTCTKPGKRPSEVRRILLLPCRRSHVLLDSACFVDHR